MVGYAVSQDGTKKAGGRLRCEATKPGLFADIDLRRFGYCGAAR